MCTSSKARAMAALAPKIRPPGSVSKIFLVRMSPRQLARSSGDYNETDPSELTAQVELVPSASALIVRVFNEPPRNGKY